MFTFENIIADWQIPVDISMSFEPRLWDQPGAKPNLPGGRHRGYMFSGGLAYGQSDSTKADRIFKNNYAINELGNIITALSNTSSAAPAISFFNRALVSEDFPTLGIPTIAIRISDFFSVVVMLSFIFNFFKI